MVRSDQENKMKRMGFLCGAVAVAIVCAAPHEAAAGDGNGFVAGLVGGLAAGTLFGIAASSPPPVVYVAPPLPAYAPNCYWTRGRPVWNGYRWHRPHIQVCE
jgi:4-amino-4-deoxy-L-arabinose transferase-like glycosyltransferase